MPRGERPLDDDNGPLTRFAADLRALRERAGSPPYRKLSQLAHYSATTLADAAGGHKLPSLTVTLAYVRACDGDTGAWEERWRALAAELAGSRRTGPEPANDDGDCPYVGLAPFQFEDAARFFGRNALVHDLVDRVCGQRFVALFGASGSGKSSILRAGLLPHFHVHGPAGTTEWPTLLLTPGPHPLEECAARLAALTGRSATALHDELRDEPRALHLTALQILTDRPADAELLLVVDQFEEVFTLCPSARERDRFVEALVTASRAANARTRIVIGVRADFYAHCADHPRLVEVLRDAPFLVGAMTTDELRQTISKPAVAAGCTVEQALLARVVADATGQANALPLVSHALRETWRRRRGNALTLAGYEAAGGIQHALAQSAEAVHDRLSPPQQQLLRWVFLRLIALGEGTDDTKRRVPRAELDAAGPGAAEILDTLAGARLVTLDTDTVEIAHEALIHAWPRLRGWLTEDRAGLLIHQQLTEAAATWEREHRDPGLLYRGGRLATAREWAERQRADTPLGDKVGAFLAASTRQERRASRLRRAAVAVLAVLALLASTTAVIAFQQRSTARAERARAVAARVLAEADQARGSDPSLAAQLALASYRMRQTPQAATSLLDTGNLALSTPLTGHTKAVYATAFAPDGRLLVTGSGDNTIRLWDVREPGRPKPMGQPLAGHRDWVYWLQFTRDGHTLASASRDGTVRLWDMRDARRPRPWGQPLTGHTSYVFSVSFSPDGRTLATASQDTTLRLWDVSDPARPHPLGQPLTGHTTHVASAAYSPDGRTVASAGHDRTVRLWNVTDPRHPAPWGPPLNGHSADVYSVAFSPDSKLLASVSDDKTVRLWDIADPARPSPVGSPLTGHTNTVLAVAFAPDGRTLATGGSDNTIRLWNLTDPAHATPLGSPLVGHTGFINWIAFGPDGHTLASSSDDTTARLWNLPRTTLTGHSGPVSTVALSPDGATLASAGGDRTIRLWNTRHTDRPEPLGSPLTVPGAVLATAFSPNGRLLAALTDDHSLRLWDVDDPAHPVLRSTVPTKADGDAKALAFDPAGRLLATDGADHTLTLWDIGDPSRPRAAGPPLAGPISPAHWARFSPDGHTLASGSADDKIRLWDVSDPAHSRPLSRIVTGDTGGIHDGSYHPTGRVLATAGDDHTVRLWDVRDPSHPTPLGQPLRGHTGPVYCVGFSPDGHTLAGAGLDRTIRLWDTADPAHPTPRGTLTAAHTGPVEAAAFTPDGTTLASAGDDRTTQLTNLRLNQAIRHVCTTTASALTQQKWEQYVPGEPFVLPCH
ncbi:hypothetical protein ACFYWU_34650 [Streptomyces chrestomyceticus]|uniref:nSTAND1 domain-containing NTPase n=1 Tax=Streptomyces chrestomyceticus TaxID=68185 RepID=UPI0036912D62